MRIWQYLFVFLCATGMQCVNAASFNVNPIGFSLSTEHPNDVLQIKNMDVESVRIQVEAVAWNTDGREEILKESDEIVLNPPIFTILPGQTQFLRFGLRHQFHLTSEKSYRLLINEVSTDDMQKFGLRTLLKVSIPIFIVPQKQQKKITWHLQQREAGLVLVAENQGNVHSKIIQIQLSNPDGTDVVRINAPAYILPGQRKEWLLASEKMRGGLVRLNILTDKDEIEEHLTLEADRISSR